MTQIIKTPITISQIELINLLKEVDKSTFINIVSETVVKMNKRNNPYFELVLKHCSTNYLIGNDYEKRVITNEKKEGLDGDFKTQENWFDHVSKCVVVNRNVTEEKPLTHYLMVERFDEIKPISHFSFNGELIEKNVIEEFLPKSSPSTKQVQDKKVFVQTFTISNIKECSFGGQKYIVE